MTSESLVELQPLSPAESERLKELENIVEAGIKRVLQIGPALLEIRDSKLFRATHARWEDYLRDRWNFSTARGHQVITHASILQNLALSGCAIQPSSDDRIRYLAAVDPADRSAVWELACQVAGGQPTSLQVKEVRDQLGVRHDHCKGRAQDAFKKSDQDIGTPEDWLSRGQEIVEAQRRSEYELGAWFEAGNSTFGHADKLLDEISWTGPSKQELHRKAAVARQFPVNERPLSLPFKLVEKAVISGNPELVANGAKEADVREAIAEVHNEKRAVAIKAGEGAPAEQDEVRVELERMVPRIYQGLLNFFGAACEYQVLDFLSEFIQYRRDSLKDKAS